MAEVKVCQAVRGEKEAVFKRVRLYCDKKLILKELGNLKPKVSWNDEQMAGAFNEKGVKGKIKIKSGSPCKVTITLDVPFFLLPFKGVIAESIQHHLEKFA